MQKRTLIILVVLILTFFTIFFIANLQENIDWLIKFRGQISGRVPAFCYEIDEEANHYERGITYGKRTSGEQFKYFDECDGNTLIEWYCKNLDPVYEGYECPNGCFNGVCVI